jgi:ribosomal RNA assembly protein
MYMEHSTKLLNMHTFRKKTASKTMGRYTDGTKQTSKDAASTEQQEIKKKNKQGVPKEKIDSVAAIIAQNPDLPNWLKVNTPNLNIEDINDNNNDIQGKKKKNKKKKKKAVNHVNHSFLPSDNPFGLAEKSSFSILFPQYREPYLKQVWPLVQAALGHSPFFIDAELDLKSGKIIVSTNEKTFDPFIIIKARDMCSLMSRGISFEQAKRVLDDGIFSEVIKIGNFVKDVERFKRRRQRILGPDGATLKALELLTGCYIFVQGKTVSVIGDIKGIKQVKKVVEDCMQNIHPVYHIKELMIRRELEKKPELANEDWSKYLPQFKKNVKPKRKQKKKKKIEKKKKPYTPFPNPIEKSKVDLMLESGEYFLNEAQKKEKKMKEIQEKQKEKTKERMQEREQLFISPEDQEQKQRQRRNNEESSSSNEENPSTQELVQRFKEKHDNLQKKRRASEISQGKGFTPDDFIHKKRKH